MFLILLSSFPKFENLNGLQGQLTATILLLFFFGCAITSFTYLVSYLFKTPSGAQVSCIILNFLLGFVLSSIGFFLRASQTNGYTSFLRYLFSIFPAFAFSDGMTNLALISVISSIESAKYSALDMQISGVSITFLALESVIYLLIVIFIEYLTLDPTFKAMRMKLSKTVIPSDDKNVRDGDVTAEELRVLNQDDLKESSSIFIKDFKKVYPGNIYKV